MNAGIRTNAAELSQAINRYRVLSGKTLDETLKKQSGEFAWFLFKRLKAIAPSREKIDSTAQRLLAAGRGIRVRQSIRDRLGVGRGVSQDIETGGFRFGKKAKGRKVSGGSKLNFSALAVKAEIAARRSASGFLAISARYPKRIKGSKVARTKAGRMLSQAVARFKRNPRSIRFLWGASDLSRKAAEGLNTIKGRRAINGALRDTINNIKAYVPSRYKKAARQAGFK